MVDSTILIQQINRCNLAIQTSFLQRLFHSFSLRFMIREPAPCYSRSRLDRSTDHLNPAILAGRPASLHITHPALLFSRLAYPGMESLFNVLGTFIDLSNLYYSSHLRLSLFFGTGRTIEVHDIGGARRKMKISCKRIWRMGQQKAFIRLVPRV